MHKSREELIPLPKRRDRQKKREICITGELSRYARKILSRPQEGFGTQDLKMKAKGFGDTVEQIAEATGIKKVVEAVSAKTGKECGCNKRKEALNKLFPY